MYPQQTDTTDVVLGDYASGWKEQSSKREDNCFCLRQADNKIQQDSVFRRDCIRLTILTCSVENSLHKLKQIFYFISQNCYVKTKRKCKENEKLFISQISLFFISVFHCCRRHTSQGPAALLQQLRPRQHLRQAKLIELNCRYKPIYKPIAIIPI